MNWFYSPDGIERLEVSDEALAALVREGKLTGDMLLWREGQDGWRPAREVRADLFAADGPSSWFRRRRRSCRRPAPPMVRSGHARMLQAPYYQTAAGAAPDQCRRADQRDQRRGRCGDCGHGFLLLFQRNSVDGRRAGGGDLRPSGVQRRQGSSGGRKRQNTGAHRPDPRLPDAGHLVGGLSSTTCWWLALPAWESWLRA